MISLNYTELINSLLHIDHSIVTPTKRDTKKDKSGCPTLLAHKMKDHYWADNSMTLH